MCVDVDDDVSIVVAGVFDPLPQVREDVITRRPASKAKHTPYPSFERMTEQC